MELEFFSFASSHRNTCSRWNTVLYCICILTMKKMLPLAALNWFVIIFRAASFSFRAACLVACGFCFPLVFSSVLGLGYPASGVLLSGQWHRWASSWGKGLKLDQSLVSHSHNFCTPKPEHNLWAEQIVGQRLCDWVGIPVPPLEVLPGYRRWSAQVPYPSLLGHPVDSWEFSKMPLIPVVSFSALSLRPPDSSCSHLPPLLVISVLFPLPKEIY